MTAPVFPPGPSLFRDCRRAIVAGIGFEEREHSARPTRGAQPASLHFAGSLPAKFVFGRLPNTAGKLPALPGRERQQLQEFGNLHCVQRCAFQQLIA
jgi:hypothetical protein